MYCRPIFMHKMSCKSGQEWYINKSHCKNLHIIAENKILKFGACRCYRSGDSLLGVWGKTHFEKTAFKDSYGKSQPSLRAYHVIHSNQSSGRKSSPANQISVLCCAADRVLSNDTTEHIWQRPAVFETVRNKANVWWIFCKIQRRKLTNYNKTNT